MLLAMGAVSLGARAQFVNYGTDPGRYKWNIVHTEHYKLIYPVGNDTMAYRYARLLETSYRYVGQSIGESRKWKFPVVLHPGNMLSNGMVAWAPRRMELITTPNSDDFATSWDAHLVVHEGRHTFQTRKFMGGIFRPLYYVLGEQVSGLSNLAVPTWFLEGDAVLAETALSGAGRGRLPEFNMIYRAQMLSGRFYSFDKWFLGSYRDQTGTKYAMGYDMTAFARREFGADIWDKVTSRYVKKIYAIPPFDNAMKHYMGMGRQRLFDKTFEHLRAEWERQDAGYFASGFRASHVLAGDAEYAAYKYPQAIGEDDIVALKSNLSDIPALVRVQNGREERLAYVGSVNSKLIYKGGRVYWTEYVAGLRWTHENYSVLKCYDLATGKITTLTPRRRYQAPAINGGGDVAAVSEFAVAGTNQVVLLDAKTGDRLKAFDTPDNSFVKDLTFDAAGRLIVNAVGDEGMTIWLLDTDNHRWTELVAPTRANINAGFWHGGKWYFESGLNGTNNIYRLDVDTRRVERITTARFGAFTPSVSADGGRLLFADYGKNGYRVAAVSMDSLTIEQADFGRAYRHELAETISSQEGVNLDTVKLKEVDFRPKRYNRLSNLIKIHSWAPVYYDVSDIINMDVDDFSTIVKPGVMVISQNSLNTAVAQAGWYYRDGSHHGKLAFTYTGFFPVIDVNMTYGGSAFSLDWGVNEENKPVLTRNYPGTTFFEAEAHVYLPFNLTRNHYVRGIQPALRYYYTNNKIQQYAGREHSAYQYLMPELRIYNYRKQAVRDIRPQLGYQLRLNLLQPLGTGDIFNKIYAARLTGYLPGLWANNSLMLRLGYQYQGTDKGFMYIPKQIIDAPRGYDYDSATHQLLDVKVDYAFPIAYPDWSLGWAAYVKRVRSNVFFDLAANKRGKQAEWDTKSSAGVDLLADWNVLQLEFPLTTGIRLAKPLGEGGLKASVLFSVSF